MERIFIRGILPIRCHMRWQAVQHQLAVYKIGENPSDPRSMVPGKRNGVLKYPADTRNLLKTG
jgi:hypothetical protein